MASLKDTIVSGNINVYSLQCWKHHATITLGASPTYPVDLNLPNIPIAAVQIFVTFPATLPVSTTIPYITLYSDTGRTSTSVVPAYKYTSINDLTQTSAEYNSFYNTTANCTREIRLYANRWNLDVATNKPSAIAISASISNDYPSLLSTVSGGHGGWYNNTVGLDWTKLCYGPPSNYTLPELKGIVEGTKIIVNYLDSTF